MDSINLQVEMDPVTKQAFIEAQTGHDDDIILAMEKAAQELLEKKGVFMPYDPSNILWVTESDWAGG